MPKDAPRPAQAATVPAIKFGRFCVLLHRRDYSLTERQSQLRARTFEVLLTLIEANGLLVTKEELLNRIWSDRIVEEGNLQVQVLALRKGARS
jgi:DNA-binding winged helix-turn-helix (wHTH) protein